MPLSRELAVAIAAVRSACRATRHVQSGLASTSPSSSTRGGLARIKCDRSPVTVADFAAQAIINRFLSHHFPGDILIGEESASLLREDPELTCDVVAAVCAAGLPSMADTELFDLIDLGSSMDSKSTARQPLRYWTVDPVDGTKGFLRNSQYAVCVALIDGISKQVLLGVLGCPNLPSSLSLSSSSLGTAVAKGVLVYAQLGGGAYEAELDDHNNNHGDVNSVCLEIKQKRRIFVSKRTDLESGPSRPAVVRCLESYEPAHTSHDLGESLRQSLCGTTSPGVQYRSSILRMDSQCKYAVLARGDAELYCRLVPSSTYRENIWDHASGMLITTEAGGIVTDVFGKPLCFGGTSKLINNRGILASCGPPEWHKRLLEILEKEIPK